MLRQQATFLKTILLLLDSVAIASAYGIALAGRMSLHDTYGRPFKSMPLTYAALLLMVLPVWWALFTWLSLYQSKRRESFRGEAKAIVTACALGTVVLNTFIVMLRLEDVSRLVIVLFGVLACLLLELERLTLRISLRALRRRGLNQKSILVVGTAAACQPFLSLLRKHAEWGFRAEGVLSVGPAEAPAADDGFPVLGTLPDLSRVLDERVVDHVAFFVAPEDLASIEPAIHVCTEIGVEASVALRFFPAVTTRWHLVDIENVPFLTFSNLPPRHHELLVKQLMDYAIAAVLLIILAPLMLAITLAILASGGRPVIFCQRRVGRFGREFTMFKFRTMATDAEAHAPQLRSRNEMQGPVFKMRNDPRVTRVGRFLRRTSLDELPQLLNVLRGEMSLVGPRPALPSEVSSYERWQRRRQSMKPGITGIWQVSGRNQVGFDRWMRMDLEYIDRWSLWLDIKILLQTLWVVWQRKGAY